MSARRRPAQFAIAVLAAFLGCFLDVAAARAQTLDQLPPYQPEQRVSGTIRIWGHGSFKSDFMGRVVTAWASGFAKSQPGVTLENHMYGTASAIGALYVGAADLAILGEEISPAAAVAFARTKHYPPLQIDLATGSLDAAYFDYAHVVFVHKENPVSCLTLAQLDAVFGAEHRRGPRNVRTWDGLGLTGAWAGRRIQPYSWRDLDFSLFIQGAMLGGSHRWSNDLLDFGHIRRPDGSTYDGGQQILDALAADPSGIAISNLRYANPQVKPVAIAGRDGAACYAATKENLIAQTYPLTRIVPAFIDRPPGRPVDPKLREFLRYILSRDGQHDITRETAYLQLGPAAIRAQLAKLGPAAEAPPPPADARRLPGTVRVWSSEALKDVVARWQVGFQRRHPDSTLEARTIGSDVAMAGLYTDRADVALMGREPTASEVQAFEWVYRARPARVAIMTGSLGVAEKSPALAVLVHRDNPLAHLTLAQLDAVFGYEHRRGATAIRTWGQLGIGGAWAARPIALYGPDASSGTGAFFRHAVLEDSRKMNWDRMHEFSDRRNPDGTLLSAGARIVAALSRDRFGIAVAPLGYAHLQVKAVALAGAEGGAYVDASGASVASHSYPLARTVYAVVRRLPDRPADPAVEAFLAYVLGADGQAEIARDGSYFPLPPSAAKTYAQQLVDETAADNPDLLAVAMHVKPPKGAPDLLIASRNRRVASSGSGVEIELVLKDTSGANAGALALSFPYQPGRGTAALRGRAERIRDRLSRRILNEGNLLDPYPLDPLAPTKTRAQRLVEATMAAHPELLSLALHVTLPNGTKNIILGSSFGRIGKQADEDDMRVIESGKPITGVYAAGRRFGAELVLQDAALRTIGALSVGYPYEAGADRQVLLARAERLRDELRLRIASVEQLVEPDL